MENRENIREDWRRRPENVIFDIEFLRRIVSCNNHSVIPAKKWIFTFSIFNFLDFLIFLTVMYQHLSGFLIRVSGHVLIRYQYCTDTVSRPLRAQRGNNGRQCRHRIWRFPVRQNSHTHSLFGGKKNQNFNFLRNTVDFFIVLKHSSKSV